MVAKTKQVTLVSNLEKLSTAELEAALAYKRL
jgi:hypothetical protein